MISNNFFRVALVFVILSFFAGAALATFANPASGSTIKCPKGKTFKINVHGVQNCTFDATVLIDDPNVVEVADGPLTDLKNRDFVFTAKNAGNATITITTLNGTCPGAVHTYTIEVTLDGKLLVKEANGEWKPLLANYNTLNNNILNGLQTDVGIFLNVAKSGGDVGGGISTLRNAIVLANNTIATNTFGVLQDGADVGTGILNNNLAGPGLVPPGLIDGTGGDWNKFEAGVQKVMDKTDVNLSKVISSVNKSAAKDKNNTLPRFGFINLRSRASKLALNCRTPIPHKQTPDTFPNPIFPTGIVTNGVFGGSNNNGAVTLGGLGNPGQTINISLTSIDPVVGGPALLSVGPLGSNAWDATFPNLAPGQYFVDVSYGDNDAVVFGNTLVIPGAVSDTATIKPPSTSTILKVYKSLVVDGSSQFLADVASLRAAYAEGDITVEEFRTGLNDLNNNYIETANNTFTNTLNQGTDLFSQALDSAGASNTQLPPDFIHGAGSGFDKLFQSLVTTAAKENDKVIKKIQQQLTNLPEPFLYIGVPVGQGAVNGPIAGNANTPEPQSGTEILNAVAGPTTNGSADNGVIYINGNSNRTTLNVRIVKKEIGKPDVNIVLPAIFAAPPSGFFFVVFSGLEPGAYQVKLEADSIQGDVGAIVFVDKK